MIWYIQYLLCDLTDTSLVSVVYLSNFTLFNLCKPCLIFEYDYLSGFIIPVMKFIAIFSFSFSCNVLWYLNTFQLMLRFFRL